VIHQGQATHCSFRRSISFSCRFFSRLLLSTRVRSFSSLRISISLCTQSIVLVSQQQQLHCVAGRYTIWKTSGVCMLRHSKSCLFKSNSTTLGTEGVFTDYTDFTRHHQTVQMCSHVAVQAVQCVRGAHLLVVVVVGAEMNLHLRCRAVLLVANLRQAHTPASPSVL